MSASDQFPDGRRKSVSEQSDTTLQSRGKVDHHLVHHPEPEQAVNKRECVRTGLDKGDTVPFLFPSGERDERYRFLKVPYRLLPDPGDTVFVRRILQRGEGLPLQQAAVKGEKGHKLNLCHKLIFLCRRQEQKKRGLAQPKSGALVKLRIKAVQATL